MKYPSIKPGEVVSPHMDRFYRMACCDCGLVHKMLFRVVKETARKGDEWNGRIVKNGYLVVFQAWRDNRATATQRRKKSK